MDKNGSICRRCANLECKLSGRNAWTFICREHFIPREKKSNRDLLREMSNEELAAFIYKDAPRLFMRTPKEIMEWLEDGADA